MTYPDVTWADVSCSDMTVIRFMVKQQWIYAAVITEIDGWITGSMKCEFGFDSFRIHVWDRHHWRMGWLHWDGDCLNRSDEVAYINPYIQGVRFCNPLEFSNVCGCYRSGELNKKSNDLWWKIIDSAQVASRNLDLCQFYYCNSFRWSACDENRTLLSELFDASSDRGYVADKDVVNEYGRGSAWLECYKNKVWLDREESQRIKQHDQWVRFREKRRQKKLSKIRNKPLTIKPLELIGSHASITNEANRTIHRTLKEGVRCVG